MNKDVDKYDDFDPKEIVDSRREQIVKELKEMKRMREELQSKRFKNYRQESLIGLIILYESVTKELLTLYILTDALMDAIININSTLEKEIFNKNLSDKLEKLEKETELIRDEGIQWVLQDIHQKFRELENSEKDG